MSRNVRRQMAREIERKELALVSYAIKRYGETVAIADLHPEVRSLFALCFELYQAHEADKKEDVDVAADAIANFMSRFRSQKKSLTRQEEAETVVPST